MPYAARRPCAEPTCSKLVTSGRCPFHQRLHLRQQRVLYPDMRPERSSWERGYQGEHRARRAALLMVESCCRACGEQATDMDHIDEDKTNNDPINLQPLCHSCHSRKTASTHGWGRRHHTDGHCTWCGKDAPAVLP